MTFSLHGIGASKGIAIGKVHMVARGLVDVPEYFVEKSEIEREVERFGIAVAEARAELGAVREHIPPDTDTDIAAFIDTHLLMLDDSAITSAPIRLIREEGRNAEWALKLQRDALVAVFDAMDDDYLRTRKNDIDHVVNTVQMRLLHTEKPLRRADGSFAGKIVFADDLTPADTVLMQHQGVAALVTEFGGPNSHTAILARSLRIPAVVGLHNAGPYLRDEDTVIVDGRKGVVLVGPDDQTVRHYKKRQREIERIHAARRKLRFAPTVTCDGESIVLQANVELPADLETAVQVGAQGIGLYRTEYLFMNRDEPPGEEEQYQAYTEVMRAGEGAPVTIRTLDLGADKQVDGSRPGAPVTSNPALGLRAVRLCLKEPGLFRPQLRAILRTSAHGPVRMMIPMLSTTAELAQVLELIKACRKELDEAGQPYDKTMPVGAMIEVPAAAICADIFARELDFLSIGTNDLIQYTIAIDRVDDEVNYLYDPLHPAVLRLIQMTIRSGQKVGIPVAMCGEMAGDARYTRLLLGMGLKEFSVHPNALLEVKQVITESHVRESRKFSQRVMRVIKSTTRSALLEEMNRL
ncbi:MAG: phosphoenolpyruvate--protein phosphotransferase [Gammaproteobacteria bacterium]|nr:phosphoenolpyruvate--protein phosphotransferase [Gammaproteobacteria bacterium]NIM72466.1 phosphoenolpyruvate--protein phosphotransferase [Gammaproteobacteria bacterium]NIO24225.1 phosphoenolpyruvate--protein phosphotransferase [Gammaproteobacteria bacterium]NIO64830.1 phosphoenolpyruvate--protein phosphotransferase [Gammaproteobacteria bacterium]NIP44871.1 phosphoenolpyruvate--protein phosphotransferase [Gammaproteobacteria bacterium]